MTRYTKSNLAALLLLPEEIPALAHAKTPEERLQRREEAARSPNNGEAQPTPERMRQDFPFLAEASEDYALGDARSRPGLDNRTRQLAAGAAFAANGEPGMLRVHAGYAPSTGVPEDEPSEVVYMATVPAGFPGAIAASQVLSQLFAGREDTQ